MSTNPNHGYLTEPKWMQSRNVIREAMCLGTWAELAALASILFMAWIVLS